MDNQRQQVNAGQSQQTEYLEVLSAAQSLVSVLTQTLNQSPVPPCAQVQVQGHGQQTALKFPVDSLELHASLCGEENILKSPDHSSFIHNDDSSIADETANSSCRQVLCLEDILELLAGRVNAENQFRICVSLDNLLERGLKQWQRQKKGNPANQLKITFIGEAEVDSGALRKEFLTEMISGIEKRLFLGQRAKSPQYSNSDLDNGLFRTAGELFAVSLAQGGAAHVL
ncbi:uncharacterized protein LOC130407181 [Triplophysa dalaica]|uniref:uncharacterized protein LOC130407181 n=1 Tax=Triplophysa dalaica TaxID=1582913 RepID=UPI0024DF78E0|nr:uncharacterized protein LOC130407181 [Triplophysa dalaica]